MNITLQIPYNTTWGESLQVRIGRRRLPMEYTFGGLWTLTLGGRELHDGTAYRYEVVREGAVIRREWRGHTYQAPADGSAVTVRDRWIDRPSNSTFYASAFSDVIFRRSDGASFRHPRPTARTGGNVTLVVTAPEVRSNESVGLVGSGKALGDWKKVHLLDDGSFPGWRITLNVQEPFAYKFVVVDTRTKAIRLWENGADHFFAEVPAPGTHVVEAGLVPVFPTLPWRGAGVAVPVFSLRTRESFGVGDFHDIKKLVDWAVATGQSVIQLLPINDTTMTHTWQDSYPYNAVSSFALHPMFVHLPDAGVRKDAAYRQQKATLEALPKLDYEQVNEAKTALLRKAFASRGEKVMQTPAYKEFAEENASWLLPYAVFSALRDAFGTPDTAAWGEYATYSPRRTERYAAAHPDQVHFWCYVQYLLDAQLKDVVAYAHSKGVALKGDLPIGVSRQSVDAWQHPSLFHLDSQAGAPPDAFSADGQNWGFPTYNWEKMAEDGFAWWKARMHKMSAYFDAFRIDHILGFFRIWEIPARYQSGLMGHFSPALPYSGDELRAAGFCPETTGDTDVLFVEDPREPDHWHPRIGGQNTHAFRRLSGEQQARYNHLYDDFFYHRHNAFWQASAYRKLPALLRSTGMLSCGEDLGMIPACVPATMDDLNILSLEIQRMPKNPEETFAHPARYPYFCVCATGTHDTSPLRAWWEEDRALTQRYFHEELGEDGPAPYFCEPWVAEKVVDAHLHSPAMLAILPLQDYLAEDGDIRYPGDPADERINIPAIARHYWRYRLHCTIEDLLEATAFNEHLKGQVAASGRNR